MLRFLRIQHLAVIDSAEVEFDAGLNVLTGETGAGKSILVEAIGLLLGGRASGDLVRTGEQAASIEAIFESGGEELLIRRELTAQGRSRAFVNGTLATAGALKDLSGRLIELHGQHEHQTLLDPATHVPLLDAFGGLESHVAATESAFDQMRGIGDDLARARATARDRQARSELIALQLGELDRAAPTDGEDEQLAATRQVLASAERVERLCEESYSALYERDDAVLSGLGGVWRRVSELAALDPRFQPYVDARDGIKSQLEDLAQFLRRYADQIEASPARLQAVEERLALLERVKRKYGPTLAEVVARRQALQHELEELEHGDERIEQLERQWTSARGVYIAAADALSVERHRIARRFASELEQFVAQLAMERTRFEVRFGDRLTEPNWTSSGVDVAEFFISPNPGEALRPLARIVSGGEMSRVMLAIKTLTAASRHGFSDAADRPPSAAAPGLIFDEIDAGIGGRVADVVGRKLRALASGFQVLCITHVPQIAAYADAQFRIDKRIVSGRTRTSVHRLDRADRVAELARMVGGDASTDGARAAAREMLDRGAGGGRREAKAKGESESRRERDSRRPATKGKLSAN